jgi:hypothetical protein
VFSTNFRSFFLSPSVAGSSQRKLMLKRGEPGEGGGGRRFKKAEIRNIQEGLAS